MAIDTNELKQENEHQLRTIEDIVARYEKEDRDPTTEENDLIQACMTSSKKLLAQIADIEAKVKRTEEVRNYVSSARGMNGSRVSAPQVVEEVHAPQNTIWARPKDQRLYESLKAFTGPNAEKDAYDTGMWLIANFGKDYPNRRTAHQYCREHGLDVRGAVGDSPNTGAGVLVPEQTIQRIITLRENYGVARQECDIVPMDSDFARIPRRAAGMQATFVGPDNPLPTVTYSDLGFDGAQLVAKDLVVASQISKNLVADAIINFADKWTNEAAWALAKREDECLFTGTGTSTYGKIQGVKYKFDNNSYSGAVNAASGHSTFANVDATDLSNLMAALPDYAHEFAGQKAKFYCSRPFYHAVFDRLKALGGGNTVITLGEETQPQWLGYPIVITQTLPLSPTTSYAGQSVCFFGNMRLAASLGTRLDVEVSLADQRFWENRAIGLMMASRLDINVHDLGYLTTQTPLTGMPTNGPLVALLLHS